MSSINTNASAMTALQSLSATNKNLETTQSRISTGLRVSQASDNAAYWSIATTMRSDNKAMSTVQDALGLGAATLDTAYTGMESAIETVDAIKQKLLAAKQPGVDKEKIQSEITQLQKQLSSTATASSFNGQNWLTNDQSAAGAGSASLVSSFTRDANNNVSVGTTDVDVSGVVLFDTQTAGTKTGILDAQAAVAMTNDGGLANGQAVGDGTDGATVAVFGDMTGGVTLDGDAKISFNLSVNGESHKITIDKQTVSDALNSTDGVIADEDAMVTVLNRALSNAGLTSSDVTVAANGTAVEITNAQGVTAADTLSVSDAKADEEAGYAAIGDIDITAPGADLDELISGVDKQLAKMATAAADMGAIK
ncbi:MAG TPA: flagellin C, partial [Rhizobiaceae bacterium]|nr:flagellin C [Rhizobiaceae bacterium]